MPSCPRCQVALKKTPLGRICPQCDGVMLSFAQLERVLKLTTGRLVNSPLGATLQPDHTEEDREQDCMCPDCGKRMRRFPYMQHSEVIVDVCRDHGMWLDDGELTEIRQYLEDTGGEVPTEGDDEEPPRGFFARLFGLQ